MAREHLSDVSFRAAISTPGPLYAALLALAFSALALGPALGTDRQPIAAIRLEDVTVTIISAVPQSQGDRMIRLMVEPTDSPAGRMLNYGSMALDGDIDCPNWRNRVSQMVEYSGRKFTGNHIVVTPPRGWIRPTVGAFMREVLTKLCDSGALQKDANDGLSPGAASSGPPPQRVAEPVMTPGRSARASADTLSLRGRQLPSAYVGPATDHSHAGATRSWSLQIASSPNEGSAKAALAAVQPLLSGSARGDVERAMVRGQLWYRRKRCYPTTGDQRLAGSA
jgi:hypothetical protein